MVAWFIMLFGYVIASRSTTTKRKTISCQSFANAKKHKIHVCKLIPCAFKIKEEKDKIMAFGDLVPKEIKL
jgi:hypothetical protein